MSVVIFDIYRLCTTTLFNAFYYYALSLNNRGRRWMGGGGRGEVGFRGSPKT